MKLNERSRRFPGSPRARVAVGFAIAAMWFVAVSGVSWSCFDEGDTLGPHTLRVWLTHGEVCDWLGCRSIEMQTTWTTFAGWLRALAWVATVWSILLGALRSRRRPPRIVAWMTIALGIAGMGVVVAADILVVPDRSSSSLLDHLSWGAAAMFMAALLTLVMGLESTGYLDRWKRKEPPAPPPPEARVVR